MGQYSVAPAIDFNRDATLDTPYNFKNKKIYSEPKIEVNRDFNPFKNDHKVTAFPYSKNQDWESLYVDIKAPISEIRNIEVKHEIIESNLFDSDRVSSKTFQIHGKYIISTIKSGVIFINQNLAHQRILYEEFLETITVKEAMSQQLLFPLDIHFSKDDVQMIREIQGDLESTGFLFDRIEDETIIVKGIPTTINESQVTIIIEQLLDDIKNEIPDASFSRLDVMAKSMAKSLAIKNGAYLSKEEQENIVEHLFACKESNHSPFGKPTFISMETKDIDKKFEL